jgi:flagellar hook protein FlgE
MGSFSIPLSGLTAAQGQLQTVSNNLANIGTDGYKDENLTFSDIFSQSNRTNGSGDPIQTGSGVLTSSTTSNFTEGNLNPTGTSSNMALSGNGFFVTQGTGGSSDYTRAGDFTKNKAGQLTTPNGELLLGYPAVGGVVNTSAALQPLQVGNVTSPAAATSSVEITANLDATTPAGGTASSSLPIFDALGAQHTLSVSYVNTAPNTWTYSVSVPAADVTAGGIGNTIVGSGTLNFNGNGTLTSTTNVVPIVIPTYADGATGTQAITGPFGTATAPTITQTASASTTGATNQDGFTSGTLVDYSVQADGTIEGTFTGGHPPLALGQVAVASFANTQGLVSTGNNNYQSTSASGPAVVGVAGTGGRGSVVGGSVEQSNVDIATEFAKLIVAQQAYSANAKSITTFNQVSQATIAMIQ